MRKADATLRARLEDRRAEVEEAALARIAAIADPDGIDDPDYAQGLRQALSAALEYGLEALDHREAATSPVPVALLSQARRAARHGLSLDVVLRRYFAGYRLFTDLLVAEAGGADALSAAEVKRMLGVLGARFDGLIAAISEEFGREAGMRRESARQHRAQLVEGLLSGELIDHATPAHELSYDFDGHHVGVLAAGSGGDRAIRDLAGALDCRLLSVARPEQTVWSWLGARRAPNPAELEALAPAFVSPGVALAIGEPGEGFAGWRLTHRQAVAALPIAQRSPDRLARYGDVAVLASALRDDLLVESLRRLCLVPLDAARNGGEEARETLRAYLASGRNVSSAAAALGINRHTVASRLRASEEALGRPLTSVAPELETALRLDELRLMPGRRRRR